MHEKLTHFETSGIDPCWAAVVEGLDVIAVSSLAPPVAFFTGAIEIDPTPSGLNQSFDEYSAYGVDAGVRAQK